MVIKVSDGLKYATMEKFPEELEDFFDKHPVVCENNLELTSTPHIPLQRDGVLFITQRRQATSDIRENRKIKILGSHAAMTCHIVMMKHTESRVCSIGHFDNFSCWQFGDQSSHQAGLKTMIDEIEFLSQDDLDFGHIQVSVFGGYTDERGDARRNSLSLLKALYDESRVVEIVHFCVGPYNTTVGEDGKNTAILVGVALDLRSQVIFPATYLWNNFTDFETQLKDRFLKRTGQGSFLKNDDMFKEMVKDSTFKPKALRNPNTYKKLEKTKEEDENSKKFAKRQTTTDSFGNSVFVQLNPPAEPAMSREFKEMKDKETSRSLEKVKLKPLVKNKI